MLFYKVDLLEARFVLNPYDAYILNKFIDGNQMNNTWHVDNLKISHVDKTTVDQAIDEVSMVKSEYPGARSISTWNGS